MYNYACVTIAFLLHQYEASGVRYVCDGDSSETICLPPEAK